MRKKNASDELLIGAHTSASGGVFNALLEGKEIGATTIQLFTANQRQWKSKPLSEETIELFQKTLEETHLKEIMSHSSYLINLGAPDPLILEKSLNAFEEEIDRCQKLGITYLNFHPGAALTSSHEECVERIVASLLSFENLFADDSLHLLLETTAGQGSTIGSAFEELSYILERVKDRIPIGVCIDTCHIFSAGYDIRTHQGWNETLAMFDKLIGIKELRAFHLNDSMKGLGERKDRHASLGEGEIGLECFRFLMTNPLTKEIPKYLETPDHAIWDKEIGMLREFAKGKP